MTRSAAGTTSSEALWLSPPGSAVIVALALLVTGGVLTVNFATEAPAGTVMVVGTLARAGLLLWSETANPLAGAGLLRKTRPVLLRPPVTVAGRSVTRATR